MNKKRKKIEKESVDDYNMEFSSSMIEGEVERDPAQTPKMEAGVDVI